MILRLREANTGEQSRITIPDDTVITLKDVIPYIVKSIDIDDGNASITENLNLKICFRNEPEGDILDLDACLGDVGVQHGSLVYWEKEKEKEKQEEDVECTQCNKKVAIKDLEHHLEQECSERLIECSICSIQLPIAEIVEHEESCGSRTEKCEKCDKYVRLRDFQQHEASNCEYPKAPVPRVDPRSDAEIMIDQIRARTLGDFFYTPASASASTSTSQPTSDSAAYTNDKEKEKDNGVTEIAQESGQDQIEPKTSTAATTATATTSIKCAVCEEQFDSDTTLQRHVLDHGHADFDTLQALALVYGEDIPMPIPVAAVNSISMLHDDNEKENERESEIVDMNPSYNYDVITDIPCDICGLSFPPDSYLEHQVMCEGEGDGLSRISMNHNVIRGHGGGDGSRNRIHNHSYNYERNYSLHVDDIDDAYHTQADLSWKASPQARSSVVSSSRGGRRGSGTGAGAGVAGSRGRNRARGKGKPKVTTTATAAATSSERTVNRNILPPVPVIEDGDGNEANKSKSKSGNSDFGFVNLNLNSTNPSDTKPEREFETGYRYSDADADLSLNDWMKVTSTRTSTGNGRGYVGGNSSTDHDRVTTATAASATQASLTSMSAQIQDIRDTVENISLAGTSISIGAGTGRGSSGRRARGKRGGRRPARAE